MKYFGDESMSISKALQSLEGLATGDAFGEAVSAMPVSQAKLALPPSVWRWTDDTHMAMSIVEILSEYGEINQDQLALRFAARFAEDPFRGYAFQAFQLLESINAGADWRDAAVAKFPDGSYGNGAAMRAAPIGAFFAGQPEEAARQADLSAQITHAHPEGRAGGIAVAVAASCVAGTGSTGDELIDAVAEYTPPSVTRDQLIAGKKYSAEEWIEAAIALGTGIQISAQDTVPFCVWMASRYPEDYEHALWDAAAVGGDMDTVCAITGGIIAAGNHTIPAEWIRHREPIQLNL
jgi:ADP-ribosylglycohydrolase